jgi:WD40 repeat protein
MRPIPRIVVAGLLALTISAVPAARGQQDHKNPPGKQDGPAPARVDAAGDPLPAGVLARLGAVRLDPGETVLSAVFSADGKTLSVVPFSSADQVEAQFFDLGSGKTARRLPLPRGAREQAFTPDERFLVVRSFYQKSPPGRPGVTNFAEIHVLDGAAGKPLWKTDANIEFASMALSPDGKLLAGGVEAWPGKASDVFLWDTATGKQRAVLQGHRTAVKTLAFAADGSRLVSASEDVMPVAGNTAVKGNVCVWALPDGQKIKELSRSGFGHEVSPTGQTIAFAAERDGSKEVLLWDLDADKEIARLPVAAASYRFSHGGRALVTGSTTDMLRLWDTVNGRPMRRFKGLVGNGVRPLAFSGDDTLLATQSSHWTDDHSVRLWDVVTGSERHPFPGHALDITCLSFAPDGNKLVSGSLDRTVRVWATATGKQVRTYDQHEAAISAVAVSPDGRTVASGDRAGVTHLWDAGTGKPLQRLGPGPADPKTSAVVSVLSFAADGKTLWIGTEVLAVKDGAVVGGKGELARVDTATGKQSHAVQSDQCIPRAVSPDGALAVWTQILEQGEEKIFVRRTDTGRELYESADKEIKFATVDQVRFSPDGRLLALHARWSAESFFKSGLVPCYRLVEAADGKEVVNKTTGADYPWTIFLPGGRVLAGSYQSAGLTAPVGGLVRVDGPALAVVDAATGKKAGEVPSYPLRSGAWAVTPDARFLAAVSDRRTVLVWEISKLGWK